MRCPICKHALPNDSPTENRHFPFCSDRCKLIDLGRWLDGKSQIPIAPDEKEIAEEETSTKDDIGDE